MRQRPPSPLHCSNLAGGRGELRTHRAPVGRVRRAAGGVRRAPGNRNTALRLVRSAARARRPFRRLEGAKETPGRGGSWSGGAAIHSISQAFATLCALVFTAQACALKIAAGERQPLQFTAGRLGTSRAVGNACRVEAFGLMIFALPNPPPHGFLQGPSKKIISDGDAEI